MFLVMGHAGGVAVPPFSENLEVIADFPVHKIIDCGNDSGFFLYLAPCCLDQAFRVLLTAGNGLPITGVCRAFK